MSNSNLSPPPTLQSPETNKFYTIPLRLDDLKKLWKTLRTSLLENLTSFTNFDKSFAKASHSLYDSIDPSDPSYLPKLIQLLAKRQVDVMQPLGQCIDDLLGAFNQDLEIYEEKIEDVRVHAAEGVFDSLRQLDTSKASYTKERADYEKICKDSEALIVRKSRKMMEPVVFYDMTQQRRVRERMRQTLRTLRTAEKQTQDAVDAYNVDLETLTTIVSRNMDVFKGTIREVFDNVLNITSKHNQVLQEFLRNELGKYDNMSEMSSLDNLMLNSKTFEHTYIETRRLASGSPSTQKSFINLHNKLLQQSPDVGPYEAAEYFDLAQGHFQSAVEIFEERAKVVLRLKEYIQSLNALCNSIEKTQQKLSKNSASQACNTPIGKRLGSTIDPLYEGFGIFGSVFQQFSAFINMKVPLLDGIIGDQREHIKTFQTAVTRILKDRPEAFEAARKIGLAFEEYQTQEYSKFSDFSHVIKGIMAQKFLLFKRLLETLGTTQSSLRPKEAAEIEISRALLQDEGFKDYLDYIGSGQADLDDNNPTEAKILYLEPMIFQRLYVPIFEGPVKELVGNLEEEVPDPERALPGTQEARFRLKRDDKVIDDFTCGVEHKIIRSGKMYVYGRAVCFSTVKLLGDLALKVPLEDIVRVEKRVKSLVFDTALTIVTKYGEIRFVSFLFRNRAYNLIFKLLKEVSPPLSAIGERSDMREGSSREENPAVIGNARMSLNEQNWNMRGGVGGYTNNNSISMDYDVVEEGQRRGEAEGFDSEPLTLDNIEGLAGLDSISSIDEDEPIEAGPEILKEKSSSGEKAQNKGKFSTAQYLAANISSPLALSYTSYNMNQGGQQQNVRPVPENFTTASMVHTRDLSPLPLPIPVEGLAKSAVAAIGQESNGNVIRQGENKPSILVTPAAANTGENILKEQENNPEGWKMRVREIKSDLNQEQQQRLVVEQPRSSGIRTENKENLVEDEEMVRKRQEQAEITEKKRLRGIIDSRKERIRKQMMPEDTYQITVFQQTFDGTAIDLFSTTFADRKVKHKNKQFESIWQICKDEVGDTEIKMTPWTPLGPVTGKYEDRESLETIKKFAEGVEKSTKNLNFTHPVKEGGPFVPKACPVEEKHVAYWLGPDEIVVQNEVLTSKVPMSDTFVVRNQMAFKDLHNGKCELVWKYGIEFVKSTMFKGKISKSSQEGTQEYIDNIFIPLFKEQYKIYLQEKAQEIRKRDASKRATPVKSQEFQAQRNLSRGSLGPQEVMKEVLNKVGVIEEEKNVIKRLEAEIEEIREFEEQKEMIDQARNEEYIQKNDLLEMFGPTMTATTNLAEEFEKFVKMSHREKEEMKSEIKLLRNFVGGFAIIVFFMLLFIIFKI